MIYRWISWRKMAKESGPKADHPADMDLTFWHIINPISIMNTMCGESRQGISFKYRGERPPGSPCKGCLRIVNIRIAAAPPEGA